MRTTQSHDLYSPREIALAAGVPEADVLAALGGVRGFVGHAEAVRLGRALAQGVTIGLFPDTVDSAKSVATRDHRSLFSLFSDTGRPRRTSRVPLAVSSTLHAGVIAGAVFIATFNLSPRAAALRTDDRADPMRLVFVATPGPGGGGGGGGLLQKAPPPKALREGRRAISSPLPERRAPKPIEPAPAPPEPKPAPPLKAEQLPMIVAPIITAPADRQSRVGVLQQTTAETQSHGPGSGGGAETGAGTGLGEGQGSGVGPGSGGGTGGGPYRPGSGIEPPRLLREVKADFTEDARQRGIAGDVILEIVVRRDGSVGDVKILQGLGGGLNDRAVQAVRQWRFTPAYRQGAAVDVIVEVAVEFKLR
jgi:TonB family protein